MQVHRRFFSIMHMLCETTQTLSHALSPLNLRRAAVKTANYYRTQNFAGSPDAVLLERLKGHALNLLRDTALSGAYHFQPLRLYFTPKPKGGLRTESLSSPLDRVLVQALFNVPGYCIQQALSQTASMNGLLAAPAYRFNPPNSRYAYSFWPADYRAHRRRAMGLARRMPRGFVLHADIQNFFPTVCRKRIRTLLRPWFHDSVWPLVDQYLDFQVVDHGEVVPLCNGLPIEEPMSRLLANLYLEELDRFVIHTLNIPCARYVDDLMLFLPSEADALRVYERLQQFLAARLGLSLNATKVEILPAREVASQDADAFSRRLSILNSTVQFLAFQPQLRSGLVQALGELLRDMPSPNAGQGLAATLRLRGAKFATWRLSKVKARSYVDRMALLLDDDRARIIAAISLVHLGTPKALRRLNEWVREHGHGLHPHEQTQIVAAMVRNGQVKGLAGFEAFAADNSSLRSILRLNRATRQEIAAGLQDADVLVRRAAALNLAGRSRGRSGMLSILTRAARNERDRDTRMALLLALAGYLEKPSARVLLEKMAHHSDPMVAGLAKDLLVALRLVNTDVCQGTAELVTHGTAVVHRKAE